MRAARRKRHVAVSGAIFEDAGRTAEHVVETMHSCMTAAAAKAGRVIVYPSVRIEERSISGGVGLIARAVTAPRPNWKKVRR